MVKGHSTLRDVMKTIPDSDKSALRKRVYDSMSQAVVILHSMGIVHCDIKPCNIILAEDTKVSKPYSFIFCKPYLVYL